VFYYENICTSTQTHNHSDLVYPYKAGGLLPWLPFIEGFQVSLEYPNENKCAIFLYGTPNCVIFFILHTWVCDMRYRS